MGAIAIDMNDMVGVNAAAFRVLSDNLGDEATRAFINQFNGGGVRNVRAHPRVTASQMAAALEMARKQADDAVVTCGRGNFTEDRHKRPQKSFEEVTARIMKVSAEERARRGVAL